MLQRESVNRKRSYLVSSHGPGEDAPKWEWRADVDLC